MFKRELIIVSQRPLEKRELLAALRVAEDNPLWRAVHQIIEEELRATREMANVSVKDHGILASWTGGAEALERIRTRLSQDRLTALGQ